MKPIRRLLLLIALFIPCVCFARGSVSVSTSNVSLYVGDTTTVTISAPNSYSIIDATTSGTSASSNISSHFDLDGASGETKSITIRGLSVGTTTIRLNCKVATFDTEEEYDDVKTITINVSERPTTTTKTTTTRPPVTGGTQATINTTTQPVETTTQSPLYLDSITVGDFEVKEEDGIYYVTTDITTDSVEINATAPEGVTIQGLGKRNLNFGKNTINLTLSLPDGQGKVVQVIITRPDASDKNTLLKELEVINYKLDFDPQTKEYTVTVPYNIKDVYIHAVAQSADTSVKGSGKFSLGGSETNAFVTVSYGDVASTTYTIHIKKSYLGLVPILILTIGLIGTTGGLFFLSNKLKETKEEMNNKMVADRADYERSIEDQGPQLSINGESATGIGARVVKPQAVQPQNIKVVEARPTTTMGIVPPTPEEVNGINNPQIKVVKKVIRPVQPGVTIKQVDTHTSEV